MAGAAQPECTVVGPGTDGFSEFKLMNITPGRPIVVLRRMDYVYGDYELELSANGKKVAVTEKEAKELNVWPRPAGETNANGERAVRAKFQDLTKVTAARAGVMATQRAAELSLD